MKKIEKYRAITNLLCVISIIVLSFMPAVNTGKKVYDLFDLLSEMKSSPGFYVMAMGILLLITVVAYIIYLAVLLIKRKTVDGILCNIVIFMGMVLNVAVFMLAFANLGETLAVPVTLWLILKLVFIAIQFINIKSGEEFWKTMLKD